MWLFEAEYCGSTTSRTITRKVEFDGDNLADSTKDVWLQVVMKAYDMKKDDEELTNIEFIAN